MPQSENWPFKRIMVDHLFHGTTRVWWELDSRFTDSQPHVFQLQAGYTGNNNALDWINIGDPATNAYYLEDDTTREVSGKFLLTHYRILLTTGQNKYVSNPQGIQGLLNKKDWNLVREIIRKERLRHKLVSREGYLLKKMRHGVQNPNNTDFLTDEIINSYDASSWGTAFKVGYHPPIKVSADFHEQHLIEEKSGADISTHNSRPTKFPARFLGFPELAKQDIWVDAVTDERWYIHNIEVPASLRGIPIVFTCRFHLIPFDDIVYKIPVSQESYDLTDTLDFQPTRGTGCVRVDHDHGGDSELVYQTDACCGISGANIYAYTKENWDGGARTDQYIEATSQTTANGTWAWAMLLNPGEYVLKFEKPGEYGPDTTEITVTAETTNNDSDSSSVESFSSLM